MTMHEKLAAKKLAIRARRAIDALEIVPTDRIGARARAADIAAGDALNSGGAWTVSPEDVAALESAAKALTYTFEVTVGHYTERPDGELILIGESMHRRSVYRGRGVTESYLHRRAVELAEHEFGADVTRVEWVAWPADDPRKTGTWKIADRPDLSFELPGTEFTVSEVEPGVEGTDWEVTDSLDGVRFTGTVLACREWVETTTGVR